MLQHYTAIVEVRDMIERKKRTHSVNFDCIYIELVLT